MHKLLCIALFLVSLGLSGQSNHFLDSLEKDVRRQPNQYIDKVYLDQFTGLNSLEKTYLKVLSLELKGDYDQVSAITKGILDSANFKKDSILYSKFLTVLVDQNKITDNFESALKYLYQIIEIQSRGLDTFNLINTYITTGELYRATENFEFGLSYLKKAEGLIKQSNRKEKKSLLARTYNRKAAILMQQNEHRDSVEIYSIKSLELAKEVNDKDLIAIASNELGYLYLNQGKKKAEGYLELAIKNWEDLGYGIYTINGKLNLARYYEQFQEYDKGIALLEEGLLEINESDWLWEKGAFFEILGRLYANTGQYEKAFLTTQKAKNYLLDVNEVQYSNKIALLSHQLELDKKESEIFNNLQEIRLTKIELNSEKSIRIALIVIAFFLSLVILIIYLSYSGMKKKRNSLQSQKSINSKTNDKLQQVISQKEVLLKEINHRVKNNLSILSSLLYLQEKEISNEEGQIALRDSQIRIHSIALIHESLYQRNDMEKVDFDDFLNQLSFHINSIYGNKGKEVDFDINMLGFNSDLATSVPIGMVLNELITNSLKYAFDQVKTPQIRIYYQKGKIYYSDNGPGFKREEVNQNLGLKLIDIFTNQIGATLEWNKSSNSILLNLNQSHDS